MERKHPGMGKYRLPRDNSDLKIILVKSKDVYKIFEITELLPENFKLD